jgi:hypothetical protein
MAAFWAVFTFGGSGPALTAHGSLDLKQEIQIQILAGGKVMGVLALSGIGVAAGAVLLGVAILALPALGGGGGGLGVCLQASQVVNLNLISHRWQGDRGVRLASGILFLLAQPEFYLGLACGELASCYPHPCVTTYNFYLDKLDN